MTDHIFTVENGELKINGERIAAPPTAKRQKFKTIRNRIACGLVITIAVITAMLLASPNSRADTNSYLDRLSDAGYTGPINGWVNMGNRICTAQALAISNSLIAIEIVAKTGAGIYTADAYEIIDIADDELCPSIRSVA